MTAAVIVLAIALTVALSLIGWLVYRNGRRDDDYVAVTKQLASKTVEAERSAFQDDAKTKALAEEHERFTALEAYVTEIEESSAENRDLAPDDIATRLRRMLSRRAQAPAAGAGDPVRPGGERPVRPDATAEDVHAAGPDDLLRPE